MDPSKKKKGPHQGIGKIIKPEDLVMNLNIPNVDLWLHYKIYREENTWR